MSLYDRDTYEVMITGNSNHRDGEWITMAEEIDWDSLPEYLEPVQDHELNRMEAECLENGDLTDDHYSELYGGADL